jgi:membrane protein DedA with SNARE-associated domain
VASALGGALGDQIYFYLARHHGERMLRRSERLRKLFPRAQKLLQKYGTAVVLASRFIAGMRIAIATVCGIFQMAPLKYSTLNLLSALFWASFYGTLAYHLGPAIRSRLPSPRSPWFWGFLLSLACVVIIVRLWIRKRLAERSATDK